jgi:hypothetical protein
MAADAVKAKPSRRLETEHVGPAERVPWRVVVITEIDCPNLRKSEPRKGTKVCFAAKFFAYVEQGRFRRVHD